MATDDFSETEEDDILRRLRLLRAFGADEPVVIDGVTFDLSCDLDTRLWRPIAPLGTYGSEALRFGPRVIFPWTPSDWIEVWRSEDKPVTEAPAGSRIKIAMIRDAPLQAPFAALDLAEHRERKLAYLWVFQPDDELKLAEPPLQLIAETATALQIELLNYQGAYYSLGTKLERLIGCNDIEELVGTPLEEWPKLPEHVSITYRRALLALHDASEKFDEHAYVAFGYLMARAEAEQLLLEPALREHKAAADRARGAEARRSNSRAKTEPLRDHAKRITRANRDISLTACANAVADIVAADPDWMMGSDPNWISTQIRELFEPRGTGGGEFRPKAEWTRTT